MALQNFDALQIAITDPKSPYFQQAMAELHTAAVQTQDRRKMIDALILRILADEVLEKDLLVQSEAERARETGKKYLEGIATQQKGEHQAMLDAMSGQEPKKLIDYLTSQNDTLAKEVKELQFKLINLPEIQQKIQKAWAQQQAVTVSKFAAALAKPNLRFISPEGESMQPDEKERDKMLSDLFGSPSDSVRNDPVQLIKTAPHLADVAELDRPERAQVMDVQAMVMLELRLTVAIKNLRRSELEIDKQSSQRVLAVLKNNPEVIKSLLEAIEDTRAQKINKLALIGQALENNEPHLSTQIRIKKEKMEVNEKVIDLTKAQNARPRPSPFSSTGSG